MTFMARLRYTPGWHPVNDVGQTPVLLCDCVPRGQLDSIIAAYPVETQDDLDKLCATGKAAYLMQQMKGDS